VAAVAVASGVTITVLLRACSVVCVTIGCDVMTGVAVTAFGLETAFGMGAELV